jgi:hypothetical protein
MYLSKSDYMLSLKHLAWLWLKKHDKDKLPEVDAATQAIFDTGHEFEQYAEAFFPGSVTLGFSDYDEYRTLPERTKRALDDGVPTIFQGRFEYEDLTFICDVVQVVEPGVVDLYEIKSSTSAKLDHEYDLAFQTYVLEKLGFSVRKIAVMHVNNQYVRNGDIDASKLVATTDITDNVRAKAAETEENIKKAREIVAKKECPDMSPQLAGLGAFKDWLEVYKAVSPRPAGSIYELGGLNVKALDIFESRGITTIDAIPNDLPINKSIDKQLRAYRNNGPIVDKLRIRQFLDGLVYPLYFFDYETLSSLVPYFDGMRPYGQYPFQYSLHILDSPDAQLRHEEYLHTEPTDPAENIVRSLQSHFGPTGSVIAWNMGFEKSCNDTLAQFVPDATEFLADINDRMVDLMMPFSSGAYIDHRFKGSASIKNVLPVLVPELSYKELSIQEGAAAQRLWMQAVLDGKLDEQKQKILDDLIEYCKLDTLAMVKIYEKLENRF